MFTLIKREIQDHIAYFIGAAVLSAILIALLVSAMYHTEAGDSPVFIGLSIPVIVVLIIGCTAMGVSQMYTDRNKKISAFLSGLPVSRGRILIAKIITGILAILTMLLPLTVTSMVLWRLFAPPIPIYSDVIFDIFVVSFFMGFTCYCLGLQTGWTSSRITPTLGGLVLTCILVPLILVKGFGLHIKVILVLFIIASLIRIWQKFTSTAI
ncbi:MAG: hypothetical protein ACYTBX_03810 [Planctomycetota bacterium]|jgi:hypothetical protein